MRLLVVDDEHELTDAVARGLRREGYAVDVAGDGETALEKASINEYDLVCLDLTLPGIDGLEVCERLRAGETAGATPRILMLTARDRVDDRVAGLDQGADDYLVKPFALPELSARIRSLLRRGAGEHGSVLEVGELRLDAAALQAWRGAVPLELTTKELALLRELLSHAGHVLSQEHLLEHVWDEHTDPFTHTVRVTIANLRRKLEAAAPGERQPIETVVGAGYRIPAR